MWWIDIIIVIITNLVTGFTGWFFTKKRYEADTKSVEIDNYEKALGFYKELVDDCNERLNTLLEANKALREEVNLLHSKTEDLHSRVRNEKTIAASTIDSEL